MEILDEPCESLTNGSLLSSPVSVLSPEAQFRDRHHGISRRVKSNGPKSVSDICQCPPPRNSLLLTTQLPAVAQADSMC